MMAHTPGLLKVVICLADETSPEWELGTEIPYALEVDESEYGHRTILEIGEDGSCPLMDDARFIVLAWNSHDALLDALKNLLNACYTADAREELGPSVDGSLLDAARAAINLAEGANAKPT